MFFYFVACLEVNDPTYTVQANLFLLERMDFLET